MKEKIAIIINSLQTGGAEKTVALLTNRLHAELDIHLLMFNTTTIEFKIPDDVTVYQIGKPTSADAGPIDVLKLPLQAWRVKKYLENKKIGLVLSFLNRPNFIAGYLKLFGYRGKVILNERTNTSYYYTDKTIGGRLGRFLVKKLYSRADCIISNSIFSKKELHESFGLKNKIITINNGINYRDIQEKLKHITLPFEKRTGEFIFCHVGRYHPDKNQELLLNAFAKLKKENCRLLMIGKNIPLQFNSLANQLGIADKVILIDQQTDLLPYYAMADAFVLSSNVEGYPNVLLEAMACHLPIISTDCKWGPREILGPGTDYHENMKTVEFAQNGILVPVNNVVLLADSMTTLLDDDLLRKQYVANYQIALRHFDEARMLQLFEEELSTI
ncbi:MAG: glycosyltransferase [Ferruginibacter sp.]